MSADLEQLKARLAELQAERASVAAARTRDDAERAAKSYVDAVRRSHEQMGGFILGGAIFGDPLNSVLGAFIVSRPDFEAWLAEQAKTVCDKLSDRQKEQRLSKLDEAIAKASQEVREAAKAEAIAEVEERFGGVAA
ncbi:MAG: hypothetical protein ACJ75G_07685 [Gaiellaceae bacterium]